MRYNDRPLTNNLVRRQLEGEKVNKELRKLRELKQEKLNTLRDYDPLGQYITDYELALACSAVTEQENKMIVLLGKVQYPENVRMLKRALRFNTEKSA